MRARVVLVLAGLALVVLAICDLEALVTAQRWDPDDLGRSPDLSTHLLPWDARPDSGDVLITVRVETPHDVRVYRYRVDEQATAPDDLLQPAPAVDAGAVPSPPTSPVDPAPVTQHP